MDADHVKVIARCKEELRNPGLPREHRENIICFIKRQMSYDFYMQFFKEVADEAFEELSNV